MSELAPSGAVEVQPEMARTGNVIAYPEMDFGGYVIAKPEMADMQRELTQPETAFLEPVVPDVAHLKKQKWKLSKENVPSVHGRVNPSINVRTRVRNHQRNASLDFK